MTKDEVNKKHILRLEGKETNLIEERNRVLFENDKMKKEEKPKEKSKSNNPFGKLKIHAHEEDDDFSAEEVEVDDGVTHTQDHQMNQAEKVYRNYQMSGADDKNTITREDIISEIKKAKKDKVKLIA